MSCNDNQATLSGELTSTAMDGNTARSVLSGESPLTVLCGGGAVKEPVPDNYIFEDNNNYIFEDGINFVFN